MKQVKEFLDKNLMSLLVIGLFLVFIIRGCDGPATQELPKRDTVYSVTNHYFNDTTKSNPTIVLSVPPSKKDIPYIMLPDSNYKSLLKQYDSLLKLHYSKNIHEDSLKIDTFGQIKTRDVVYDNQIIDRQWITNLVIPEKTTTITINNPPKLTNQVYIGGSLMGSETNILQGVEGGIMFKNKKDQLYGASYQHVFNFGNMYKASYYIKINLKGK